jgi:branched-subunit amino acid transport protein AzlD
MTTFQILVTILLVSLATIIERFLPFVLFREGQPVPRFVVYLGRALPSAVFMMLVVYCFRNTPQTTTSGGLAEILAAAITIVMHKWKHSTLLSIAAGTISYMLLVQLVFA